MDEDAQWRATRCPGPDPFKAGGHPFMGVVAGTDDPVRIKPDMVHTFHIGMGQDMCASMILALAKKGCFGGHRSLNDRLQSAYSDFQGYCYRTGRSTACDEWTKAAMRVTTPLGPV